MDFEISEEQEELRTSVRAALAQEAPISLARAVVEDGIRPEEPWKTAGELGWPAVPVPEAAGGLGLSAIEVVLLSEEHGRALAPGPFLPTVTQFVPVVREAGSPEQHVRFLAPVAAGTATGALACANRAGRYDRPDESMRASPDGDGWVLDGTRHWVIGGEDALEIAVVAQVARGDGVGIFIVPRSDTTVRPITSFDATRPLCEVRLDGVRVTPQRALGSPGNVAAALDRALDESITALAAEMVGTCQALFDLTLEYAKHREQFGQPIGAFQATQHKFADLFIALEKARSTVLFSAMTLAEEDERRPLAAATAKVAAGDCQHRLAKEGIQIHGGLGYTWEQDVHLYVKRIQSGEKLLGTSAWHRARIADFLGI